MVAILLSVAGSSLWLSAVTASQPGSRPAATSPRIVAFAPGIRIDWSVPQVELEGEVILREGPLELFACSGGAKAHESIVGLKARPYHVFQALGLIGLEPGSPAWWDEAAGAMHPPSGDSVDVHVRWRDGDRDRTESACEWMIDYATGKPLAPTHWIFAGGGRLPDGRFGGDLYGTVVTVVDFGTSVLCIVPPGTPVGSRAASQAASMPASQPAELDGQHANQPTDMSLSALATRIPPLRTPVTVLMRRAVAPATRPAARR